MTPMTCIERVYSWQMCMKTNTLRDWDGWWASVHTAWESWERFKVQTIAVTVDVPCSATQTNILAQADVPKELSEIGADDMTSTFTSYNQLRKLQHEQMAATLVSMIQAMNVSSESSHLCVVVNCICPVHVEVPGVLLCWLSSTLKQQSIGTQD